MADFTLKAGDLFPELTATIEDGDGNALDISTASSVTFKMKNAAGTVVVNRAGSITDGANGRVKYAWTSGDTDTAGHYLAEFLVTYPTGGMTTPNHTEISIEIRPRIV